MSLLVRQDDINLYSFNVRSETQEGQLERALLSQIKTLLVRNNFNYKEINTIFLNKMIYFSTKRIRDVNKNPNLLLSGGWYKYGPCYEKGRVAEGINLFLEPLDPAKKVYDEVKEVFEEEFPIFKEAIEKKDQFYHSYLTHIYSNKQEYPQLKDFYSTKNTLCYNANNIVFNKNNITTNQFRRNIVDFEKAVLNEEYLSFINSTQSQIENSLKLVSLIGETIITHIEKSAQLTDEYLESQVKSMSFLFDKFIQMPFADKNYIATFKTNNERFRSIKKSEMEIQFSNHSKFIDNKLVELMEMLEPYKISLM